MPDAMRDLRLFQNLPSLLIVPPFVYYVGIKLWQRSSADHLIHIGGYIQLVKFAGNP